jgi:hypothetical protein
VGASFIVLPFSIAHCFLALSNCIRLFTHAFDAKMVLLPIMLGSATAKVAAERTVRTAHLMSFSVWSVMRQSCR